VSAPRVSVVVPAFNRGRLLAACLESVRRQTFRDHEVILVDDGSSEDLKYLRHHANLGPAVSRNDGARLAEGEFIALLDSDDVWRPEKLALQLARFREPRVLLAHSAVDWIDGRGRLLQRGTPVFDVFTGKRRAEPPFHTSTLIFRRDVLERTGPFHEAYARIGHEDDFKHVFLKEFGPRRMAYDPRPLVRYRFRQRDQLMRALRNIEAWQKTRRSIPSTPREREAALDIAVTRYRRKRLGLR
jgi:glycosyltransferase involved in cell wall biosynthesis